MTKTWILVADSSRARLFEVLDRHETLREIEDLVNPAGRQGGRDLRTDARGRYFGKGEQLQGHTAMPNTDPMTHESELFAKTVTQHLEQARNAHRYERLCLIAAPKFLGLLREKLSKDALAMVHESLDKDISGMDERAVQDYVREKLPDAGD
jgi:protein required for attachment to host cells